MQGTVEAAGTRFEAGRVLLFCARDGMALRAGPEGARLLLLGGAAMDGSRFRVRPAVGDTKGARQS